jgi:hypothetical protein
MHARGHRLLTVIAAAFVVTVAACGSSGRSTSGSSSSSTSSSSRTSSTTAPTCAGAGWADVTPGWKTLAPGPYATGRQQVAEDLAARRRGQDTSQVGQVSVAEVRAGEPLVVVLAETGGPDPAVTRVETEITLEGGDQGWMVTSARQRSICAASAG